MGRVTGLDRSYPPMPDAHRGALLALRADIDDAFDASVIDGAALVLLLRTGPPSIVFGPRGRIVDELLEAAERRKNHATKVLAAQLLVQPPPAADRYYCVIADDERATLLDLERPRGSRRDRGERARDAVAAHCLEERGLLPRSGDRDEPRFAVRAHGCSLCTAWAMALEDLGIDVASHTAPNAAKAAVRPYRRAHLCDACIREQRMAQAIARERFGIDEVHVDTTMPRAALARMRHLLRRKAR